MRIRPEAVFAVFAALTICAAGALIAFQDDRPSEHARLDRQDWADGVRDAVNDLVGMYGTDSRHPADSPYAVFDFDNTTAIFDVEVTTSIYMVQRMAFEIQPGDLYGILMTLLADGEIRFSDWVGDISAAYAHLYEDYGPFSYKGVSDAEAERIQSDPWWQEFGAKILMLYDVVNEHT